MVAIVVNVVAAILVVVLVIIPAMYNHSLLLQVIGFVLLVVVAAVVVILLLQHKFMLGFQHYYVSFVNVTVFLLLVIVVVACLFITFHFFLTFVVRTFHNCSMLHIFAVTQLLIHLNTSVLYLRLRKSHWKDGEHEESI